MEILFLKDANYLYDYKIEILFNNGILGVVDLEKHLDLKIYKPLKDKEFFKNFTLNNWTIEWENGADFAPEFLYNILDKKQIPA